MLYNCFLGVILSLTYSSFFNLFFSYSNSFILENLPCKYLCTLIARSVSIRPSPSLQLKGCISVCGKYVAIRNAREAESQPPDNDKTTLLTYLGLLGRES